MDESTKRTVRLKVQLSQAEPHSITTRVALNVSSTIGVPLTIFVLKYSPKNAYYNEPTTTYARVAYPDDLENFSTSPSSVNSVGYILSAGTAKDFASPKLAKEWVSAVYREIQRLLTELDLLNSGDQMTEEFTVITEDSIQKWTSEELNTYCPYEKPDPCEPVQVPGTNCCPSDLSEDDGNTVVFNTGVDACEKPLPGVFYSNEVTLNGIPIKL
nr:MAG TPA: hypothetical protein [Herelleviridae sp.]